ncbi:MAG: energy transducer TonB [Saprospiraceae bacterium]
MKDLLKKWINGNVTWSEEKQLRQAAEKDHFLAEAMEGYDAYPITDHAKKIEQLKGRFRKSKKEEKGLWITLSRVAAAAAVIGVIGTFFWVQNRLEEPAILSQQIEKREAWSDEDNSTPNIEVAEVVASEQASEPIAKTNEKEVFKPTSQPIKQQQTTQPIATNSRPAAQQKAPSSSTIVAAKENKVVLDVTTPARTVEAPIITPMPKPEPTTVEEGIIIAEAVASEPEAEPMLEASPIASSPTDDIAYSAPAAPINQAREAQARKSTARKKQAKVNYYVGQIRNEDGQPMQAAKIEGLNTSFNTISEQNGEFRLAVDSPLSRIIVYKDGFHTRKIDVNQYADFLNIALVRKSTFLEEEAGKKVAALEPKPVAGFVDFYKYLANNRVYPAAVKEKGIERVVEIHFYIDGNGKPTNLKVVNPDEYGFDKEAIRLLENGPEWTPINSAARYFIPFER